MRVIKTTIPDVVCFVPSVHGDERGQFFECYRQSWLESVGVDATFVQDNHSYSVRHTLRGLHYQLQQPQGKLVRVVTGEVFCVAVDLRRSSATFGCWVGEFLSSVNKKIMWVPEGFAHGFYVTTEQAEFLYKCTAYYAPEHEKTLLWNDPDTGVVWPVPDDTAPILSDKDKSGLCMNQIPLFD